MLFDFLGMMDNYEERKVDRFEKGKLIVDTCSVTDSEQSFETGIQHPNYNNGDWIIVEMYNSKKEARIGHDKWVKKMTAKRFPKELKDVSTATMAKLCDFAYGEEDWRTKDKERVKNA